MITLLILKMSSKSDEFKTKVVHKYLEIEDKKGALLQISKYYKVNISTLKLWINKFKTEGKIINLPTQGRKSYFSPNVEKKLQNILISQYQ